MLNWFVIPFYLFTVIGANRLSIYLIQAKHTVSRYDLKTCKLRI